MVASSHCSRCHVDYYHNPDVRILYIQSCDHLVCRPCVDELFRRSRTSQCPSCGLPVRFEEFSEKAFEARRVEDEVSIRRRICEIYCKATEDFATSEDYNRYLEEREDRIYAIVQASSEAEAQRCWREVEDYKVQNVEQIMRAQRLQPRKKFEKVVSIVEEEGLFCSRVNGDWGEGHTPEHPLRVRYRELFEQHKSEGPAVTLDSPVVSPQPMYGQFGQADLTRQRSGGGQVSDLCRRKARQLFFADLSAAAKGLALATA